MCKCHRPISSAGLFGRLLMNVSKASFMALTNLSFFMKQTSMMWSTLSLKSSSSCTIVLSFSGLMTIVLPNACRWVLKAGVNDTRCLIKYGLHGHFSTTIPWCTLSSAVEGPGRHSALDWRAGIEASDLEFCSHLADESTLEDDHDGGRSELSVTNHWH